MTANDPNRERIQVHPWLFSVQLGGYEGGTFFTGWNDASLGKTILYQLDICIIRPLYKRWFVASSGKNVNILYH